jgi:magnesium transporter
LIKMYNTNMTTNITTEVNEYKRGNWINMINPTESEIFEVCRNLNIEQEFIKYSLDYEEKARIDLEEDDGTILFIIDVPIIERENDVEIYTTMPVGVIFVRDEYVITVSLKENDIIKKMERIVGKKVITYKKSQFLFQLFYENSSAFLNLLKEINKKTEHIERTLKKDLKNEDLLKMLNLEKALVYITTSLKSDEVVMEKTLRGKIIKLYEEDEDLLEDAIVENKQAIEMSKIYSDILNETMDMYASIISNNINDIMKFLTSITIILAIPTLVASLWGMNVPVPFQNYQYGFPVLLAVSFVVTLTVMIWLKKRNMLN